MNPVFNTLITIGCLIALIVLGVVIVKMVKAIRDDARKREHKPTEEQWAEYQRECDAYAAEQKRKRELHDWDEDE
jgi:heme/copper-type cytochrome/quinol oxidase subunit 2